MTTRSRWGAAATVGIVGLAVAIGVSVAVEHGPGGSPPRASPTTALVTGRDGPPCGGLNVGLNWTNTVELVHHGRVVARQVVTLRHPAYTFSAPPGAYELITLGFPRQVIPLRLNRGQVHPATFVGPAFVAHCTGLL
jgi:hypothetical protein